jgi:hypothetical protein
MAYKIKANKGKIPAGLRQFMQERRLSKRAMVKRHNIRANSKSAPRPQALSALEGRGYERPASSKPKILS